MALVPVTMEVPDAMLDPVRRVLWGEYEAGFSGENLTILDIGANVGSFSRWADMRWPGSTILAYEPQPETFAMLMRNVGGRANIQAVNVAITPSTDAKGIFWSRYPGDGESGLTNYMRATFADVEKDSRFEVDLLHPSALPPADIVKIDVEGAEADIVEHLDLTRASLVLLEYQNDRNRAAIKARMSADFDLVEEDEIEWSDLVKIGGYRDSLRGDHWGHMVFLRQGHSLQQAEMTGAERFRTVPKLLGISRRLSAVRALHYLRSFVR